MRCIDACLDVTSLPKNANALDLGCAVGRSSFELARYCDKVLGIDLSQKFIAAAKEIQSNSSIPYSIVEEGSKIVQCIAHRPAHADPQKVDFRCDDVMHIFNENKTYDAVVAINLICRLPDPKLFLQQIPTVVASGGQFILVSPYSWLEEFTPRHKWLGGGDSNQQPLESIKEILQEQFDLQKVTDLPFLIREHTRKYQLGISQATVWKRK